MIPKPSRFKKKPTLNTGDITVEEWEKMNEKHFGIDNFEEDRETEDPDVTEELNFDY